MLRYAGPLVGFVVLAGFLAVGLYMDPREVPSPLVGKPAPAFEGPSLMHPDQTLSVTELSEDVSLVNVWASWCVSCRQEHPLLVQLASAELVPIFGLNYKDERTDAVRWLTQFGNPYRDSIYDPQGRIGLDWGVYGVPETFVVDRSGIIRHKHTGPLTVEVWEQELRPLIERLRAETG